MYIEFNKVTGGEQTTANVKDGDSFTLPTQVSFTLAGESYTVTTQVDELTESFGYSLSGSTITFDIGEETSVYASVRVTIGSSNPYVFLALYYHFEITK